LSNRAVLAGLVSRSPRPLQRGCRRASAPGRATTASGGNVVLPRSGGAARRIWHPGWYVTVYRWVQRFAPLLVDAARPCQYAPGDRW